MRILLLQARESTDPMRAQERRSFAAKSGLGEDRIVPHDLLEGPPTLREVVAHDALMVGGSGDYYVSRGDLPEFSRLLDVLREVVERGHPIFASCFGFQLLVRALGGEIVHDPDRTEVGTYEVTLTEAAADDPLFGGLPRRFSAQVGRKDRASRLPETVVHLASSDLCPYHALRVPGSPIWATQFHPELNASENRARFMHYLEGYGGAMTPEERETAFERFRPSPESNRLIRRFLQLVFS